MPLHSRSLSLTLFLSLCLALVSCGGGLTASHPTETVRIIGASADSLGRTLESDASGHVRVELHEGPSVWVEASEISPAMLVIGSVVVVRDASGALSRGTIAASADRIVTVTTESGTSVMLPLSAVIAVLHGAGAVPVVVPDHVVADPPPPPPDPRRFAVHAGTTELWEQVGIAACSGGTARVLGPNGALLSVPSRDVMTLGAAVGEMVSARWQDGETSYAGVVLAVEGRLYRVRYEDGSEEWVTPAQITARQMAPGATGACPRGGGDRGLVRRGRMSRVLEVMSCEGATAMARTPGLEDVRSVPVTELRSLVVPDGARIDVMWHQSSMYPGVAGASHDGMVDVRYDDGTEEATPLTDLRAIAGAPAGEPYVCPNGGP